MYTFNPYKNTHEGARIKSKKSRSRMLQRQLQLHVGSYPTGALLSALCQ